MGPFASKACEAGYPHLSQATQRYPAANKRGDTMNVSVFRPQQRRKIAPFMTDTHHN
jgi:hypothetical protein